jgi:hypothetical protein
MEQTLPFKKYCKAKNIELVPALALTKFYGWRGNTKQTNKKQ